MVHEDWRTLIAGMLHWGETALAAFREGTNDEKRALLVEAYTNLPVRDRILAPELRFPYSVLTHAPNIADGSLDPDTNRHPDPETVLNLRKNARPRDARLRAFSLWQPLGESNPC